MRQRDSTYFAVTVPRDREGYEAVNRTVSAQEAASYAGTLAGGSRKEGDVVTEIVGKSGEIKLVRYVTGSNRAPPIWPKLKTLTDAADIASFMSKWGAIDRLLGVRSEYIASAASLLQLVGGLKYLVGFVEANDIDGFLGALKDRTVFHGALRVEADGAAGRLAGEATSFAQFLVLEMWLDFGGERASWWNKNVPVVRTNVPCRGTQKIDRPASGCRILFQELPERGKPGAGRACSSLIFTGQPASQALMARFYRLSAARAALQEHTADLY
jgi:hypothetical protein